MPPVCARKGFPSMHVQTFLRAAGAISIACACAALTIATSAAAAESSSPLKLALHEREYFHTRGLDVLVFNNWYDGNFSDSKIAGIELIHHGVRTATNGDVRLSPTPEQWDPVSEMKQRDVQRTSGVIETRLAYPAQN